MAVRALTGPPRGGARTATPIVPPLVRGCERAAPTYTTARSTVADEPTPWELHRTVEALRRTVEAGFNALNTRLDRVVTNDLFQAYQAAVQRQFDDHESEIAALKAERDAEKAQRSGDRKLIVTAVFTAFVSPLVILLIQLWLTSKGS